MTEHDNEPDVELPAFDDPAAAPDFDAFWSEERVEPTAAGMPFRMFGKDWNLPPHLPALFEIQAHRVQKSSDPDEIQNLLAALLPEKLIDEMIRRRVDDRRLAITLAWATANTRKAGTLSLARAAELHDEHEAGQGKARSPRPKSKPRKKRKSSGRR